MPLEKDRATATGNMHKNLVKFGCAVFEFSKRTESTDRQTDRQTSRMGIMRHVVAVVRIAAAIISL